MIVIFQYGVGRAEKSQKGKWVSGDKPRWFFNGGSIPPEAFLKINTKQEDKRYVELKLQRNRNK